MNPGSWRRLRRVALVALAVAAIAAGATVANMALLGSVGEERIGRLRPVDATLSRAEGTTNPAPSATADDDHPASSAESTGDERSGMGRGPGRRGDGDDD
jgi:hypothetical protein